MEQNFESFVKSISKNSVSAKKKEEKEKQTILRWERRAKYQEEDKAKEKKGKNEEKDAKSKNSGRRKIQ
jgi:hypothetical protein